MLASPETTVTRALLRIFRRKALVFRGGRNVTVRRYLRREALVLRGGNNVTVDCPVPDAGALRRESGHAWACPDPGGVLLRREWATHGRRLPALLRLGRQRRYQYRLSSPEAEEHRECVRQLRRYLRREALA